MADAHSSPPQVHATTFTADPSTSGAGPSHPPDPTMRDLYDLFSAMRTDHDARLAAMRTTQLEMQVEQRVIRSNVHDIMVSQRDLRQTQLRHDGVFRNMQQQLSEHYELIGDIRGELSDWRYYDAFGYYPYEDPPPGDA